MPMPALCCLLHISALKRSLRYFSRRLLFLLLRFFFFRYIATLTPLYAMLLLIVFAFR